MPSSVAVGPVPLIQTVHAGTTFDRGLWRLIVGELLLFSTLEWPLVETPIPALLRLFRSEAAIDDRLRFDPIRQLLRGSFDICFGGHYHPETAGWNDTAAVARLADWLAATETASWTEADLVGIPELAGADDREEELALAQEWVEQMLSLYRRSAHADRVIVVESIGDPGL